MRKIFKILILLTLISSCQEEKSNRSDIKPVYFDYENSWDEWNLFGKVKSITEFRANFKANDELDEKKLQSKKWFTDFGAIKRTEYFGTFGDITQIEEYKYDSNNNQLESNTELVGAKRKIKTVTKNDTINKTTTHKSYLNDSLAEINIIFYGDDDRVKRHLEIKNNDTIKSTLNSKYDGNDNLVSEVQTEINGEESETTGNYFQYDENDRIISSTFEMYHTKYISKYKWSDNKIISREDYSILPDESKHFNESYEYDENFNPIIHKKYIESQIDQVTKYEYELDDRGNWTKRTVFLKQSRLGSKDFEKVYVELREISRAAPA